MGLNLVVQAVGNDQPTASDREFFQRAYYKESANQGKATLAVSANQTFLLSSYY
jgi:hypothetical protein